MVSATHRWNLSRVRAWCKGRLKEGVRILARGLGVNLLSKAQTIAWLHPFLVLHWGETEVELPEIKTSLLSDRTLFPAIRVKDEPTFVWHYQQSGAPSRQLPSGGLLLDGRILCTDFKNGHLLQELLRPDSRPVQQVEVLIAPFSHIFDGWTLVGYYDFMFLIAAKLCRIKEALPESDFGKVVVSYPLLHTSYEQDFLNLFGLQPRQILDSRQHRISFKYCLFGNKDSWFYPSLQDIQSLRKQLEPHLPPLMIPHRNLYVSRSGRRRILNETQLTAMLSKYDFQVIEDRPRPIVEQIILFREASFIIGPHGASFTNLIWCTPGTRVLELFSKYAPPHFHYLATALKLPYAACRSAAYPQHDSSAAAEDWYVSVPDVEASLQSILNDFSGPTSTNHCPALPS